MIIAPNLAPADNSVAVDDADTPEEVRAAARANAPTWTLDLTLPLRWSYERALVVDAKKGTGEDEYEHGPAHRLLDVIDAGEKYLQEWPSFAAEVFAALYGRMRDVVPVEPPPALGAQLWNCLQLRPEWADLVDACRGRRALSCDTAAQVLRGLMFDVLRLQDLKPDPLSQPMPGGGDGEGGDGQAGQGKPGKPTPAQALRESLGRKASRETNWAWLQALLKHVLAHAQIDESMRAALQGMLSPGGYSPGGPADDVIEEAIDMELLNALRALPHLKDLLDLIGRMQRASRTEPMPSVVRTTPDGIVQGQDVNDLLLEEHALYDAAPDLWTRRYLDKETLQTHRQGEESLAKGDVIVLVDASGSMAGEPHRWASALGGALMLEALTAGRRCVTARFSDPHRYRDHSVLTPGDIKQGLAVLSLAPDGGTATADALKKASKRLAAPMREPDIVLITDGGWPDLDEETIKATKGPDGRGRLFVILLEPSRSKESIPYAAGVWSIPQLDMRTAAEVLARVRKDGEA